MSPGDFVRTCKQVLDLLRQIEDVAPEGSSAVIRRAEAVNRGVVAYTGVTERATRSPVPEVGCARCRRRSRAHGDQNRTLEAV
jgi:hypothetical protein